MTAPLIDERRHLAGISPQILNVTLTTANTEYYFDIPDNTRHVEFKTRDKNHQLKVSFEEDQSDTVYFTLHGIGYEAPPVLIRSIRIYCQSPIAGCVVEVIIWS